jgi:4-hydroxybenzoate polyprenyltransferase
MPLAFTYPLMKRFTHWPQLFLGITFNYGLILGWTSITTEISIISFILYVGAIFWTLGYDTIYGFQDIKDDEIIGVKSTSIKFKNNPKRFLLICYSILVTSILTMGLLMNFNLLFFVSLTIPILHLFFYQIQKFNSEDKENCLIIFRSNNLFGALLLINIFIGKLN